MRDTQDPHSDLPIAELDHLAQTSSQLGFEIVDIAGFLDLVDEKSRDQLAAVGKLRRNADQVTGSNEQVMESIRSMTETAEQTLENVNASVSGMRENGEHSQSIASWIKELNNRTAGIGETLQAMIQDNTKITSIANQVNILAINAKIEAGRAGQAGLGFAVVAEAINDLSKRTHKAAADINQNLSMLEEWLTTLKRDAADISGTAEQVLTEAQTIDSALSNIERNAQDVQKQTSQISRQTTYAQGAINQFGEDLERIESASNDATMGIRTARDRIENLISSSESLVQNTVAIGGENTDSRFITFVQEQARRIGTIFETAIVQKEITTDALFDQVYRPIAGTDPQQVLTQFTELTDKYLPDVLEPALNFDPRVVFCAAVDVNGYLPTHNQKFSQPQGDDPVWNTANCRNRRIFDDRVGLKAGRNLQPFLMQVYRRDMGGGEFVMMKDLSAPIYVNNHHWGGLRLAFKIS